MVSSIVLLSWFISFIISFTGIFSNLFLFLTHCFGWTLLWFGHKMLENKNNIMKVDILPLVLWAPYWVIQDYLKICGLPSYKSEKSKGIFRESSVVLPEDKEECTAILFYDFLSKPESFLRPPGSDLAAPRLRNRLGRGQL